MKKIKPPKLSASSRQNNKLQDGSRRCKKGRARPINGLVAENGENEDGEENFATLKIEENGHVKDKPCFLIHSQQVIKSNPAFGHKKLCDGLTFTAGHPDALGRDWKQRAGQCYRSFRADYDKLLASSEMGGRLTFRQ